MSFKTTLVYKYPIKNSAQFSAHTENHTPADYAPRSAKNIPFMVVLSELLVGIKWVMAGLTGIAKMVDVKKPTD
jgi:hypothetical protein